MFCVSVITSVQWEGSLLARRNPKLRKTIGITPRGILIKQPTQIIAAKSAMNEIFKTDLFFICETIAKKNGIVNL